MSEPTGGNSLFALANRARHQIGVITTPIRFESVALNRAAPALPPLFAVNTVDEKSSMAVQKERAVRVEDLKESSGRTG